MDLATFFVEFLLTYYTYYIFDMITSKKNRITEQNKHIQLEELRAIPVKTLEEQKKFLDTKFKKRAIKKKKFKWKWSVVWTIIYTSLIYFIFFKIYDYIFLKLGIIFQLWQAVLFIIIFPLILNIVLNKFNLSKSDIGIFLRGSKNKKPNREDKK